MVALEYNSPDVRAKAPLKVGVLVDLERGLRAGGHVKCWERLAQAAPAFAGVLDLTVHFTGAARGVVPLAPNVRYVIEPPVLSTARLPFLSHVPDHTDLAPYHRRVAARLRFYDVIHTTDAFFAYARTASWVARRRHIPLVTSVHTNTPEYARLYTEATIARLVGDGAVRRLLIDRLGLARRVERNMLKRLEAHQACSTFTLLSRPEQLEGARAKLGDRVALLRRGVDRALFSPAQRDRAWLADSYGIPVERVVVIFVGRLNRGKNVMLLAEALGTLADRGLDVQLVCAGVGDQRAAIVERLGNRATCPGTIAPDQLARLYASADLFALPSHIEESANVVLEALASGLPSLVTLESGMGRNIVAGETGLILSGGSTHAWAEAIAALALDRDRRKRMAFAARSYAERHLPSWGEVLAQDLLPCWQAVVSCPA